MLTCARYAQCMHLAFMCGARAQKRTNACARAAAEGAEVQVLSREKVMWRGGVKAWYHCRAPESPDSDLCGKFLEAGEPSGQGEAIRSIRVQVQRMPRMRSPAPVELIHVLRIRFSVWEHSSWSPGRCS